MDFREVRSKQRDGVVEQMSCGGGFDLSFRSGQNDKWLNLVYIVKVKLTLVVHMYWIIARFFFVFVFIFLSNLVPFTHRKKTWRGSDWGIAGNQ